MVVVMKRQKSLRSSTGVLLRSPKQGPARKKKKRTRPKPGGPPQHLLNISSAIRNAESPLVAQMTAMKMISAMREEHEKKRRKDQRREEEMRDANRRAALYNLHPRALPKRTKAGVESMLKNKRQRRPATAPAAGRGNKTKKKKKPGWKPSSHSSHSVINQPKIDTRQDCSHGASLIPAAVHSPPLLGSPASWSRRLDGKNWIKEFREPDTASKACERSLRTTFSPKNGKRKLPKSMSERVLKVDNKSALDKKLRRSVSNPVGQLYSPTHSSLAKTASESFVNSSSSLPIHFEVPGPSPLARPIQFHETGANRQSVPVEMREIFHRRRPHSAHPHKREGQKKKKEASSGVQKKKKRPSTASALRTTSGLRRTTQHTVSSTNLSSANGPATCIHCAGRIESEPPKYSWIAEEPVKSEFLFSCGHPRPRPTEKTMYLRTQTIIQNISTNTASSNKHLLSIEFEFNKRRGFRAPALEYFRKHKYFRIFNVKVFHERLRNLAHANKHNPDNAAEREVLQRESTLKRRFTLNSGSLSLNCDNNSVFDDVESLVSYEEAQKEWRTMECAEDMKDTWLEMPTFEEARKEARYEVSRSQFMSCLEKHRFSSRLDKKMANRLFSSYDLDCRDRADADLIGRHLYEFQQYHRRVVFKAGKSNMVRAMKKKKVAVNFNLFK